MILSSVAVIVLHWPAVTQTPPLTLSLLPTVSNRLTGHGDGIYSVDCNNAGVLLTEVDWQQGSAPGFLPAVAKWETGWPFLNAAPACCLSPAYDSLLGCLAESRRLQLQEHLFMCMCSIFEGIPAVLQPTSYQPSQRSRHGMIALTLLVGCSCPVSLIEPSPHACFCKQPQSQATQTKPAQMLEALSNSSVRLSRS